VATGAWKGSSENHNGEVNCLDSWTGLPVKIPVAGLAPFPSDATSQENWAEQIVATPITMATLGQGLANATIADLQAKYDAAYESMGAKVAGQYTQGMINSGMIGRLAGLCYVICQTNPRTAAVYVMQPPAVSCGLSSSQFLLCCADNVFVAVLLLAAPQTPCACSTPAPPATSPPL
jgi:hypothetical protein